jgi:two-component system, LytTR family, response regulator LytT
MDILIIENEEIWQLKLQAMVEEAGHRLLYICPSFSTIELSLQTFTPDIIIADIQLDKGHTIFEIRDLLETIPTIFVTAHASLDFQQAAQSLKDSYFLVKPFHFLTLKALLDKINQQLKQAKAPIIPRVEATGFMITDKYRNKKIIPFHEIRYVEADGNYATIYTEEKKYSVKKSLNKTKAELNTAFVQVQKAFLVNSKYVLRVDYLRSLVHIDGRTIPMGRTYRKELMRFFS